MEVPQLLEVPIKEDSTFEDEFGMVFRGRK